MKGEIGRGWPLWRAADSELRRWASVQQLSTQFLEFAHSRIARYVRINAGHIGRAYCVVDFVLDKLPARIRNLVELATEVGVLVFLAVVIVQGAKLTIFGLGSFSLALQIPMAWVYGALPFTAALMAVYTVRRIGRRFGLGDPPRG